MRDLASNIGVVNAIVPAVQAASITSDVIDLIGFDSAAVIITTGAIAGAGDFDVYLSDSDDGTTFSDIDYANIIGDIAPSQNVVGVAVLKETVEADSVYKWSYIGNRRYLKLTLNKSGGTSVAVGAIVVKGDASARPVV